MDEFNEVIKKSGIITSDKWKLLKYVGEKNIDFQKKNEANKKEVIEYTDEEIDPFATPIDPALDDINAWKSARSAYRDIERGDGESYAAYRHRKALAK
jgi:hypothetical protein